MQRSRGEICSCVIPNAFIVIPNVVRNLVVNCFNGAPDSSQARNDGRSAQDDTKRVTNPRLPFSSKYLISKLNFLPTYYEPIALSPLEGA